MDPKFVSWLKANGYDAELLNKPDNATQRRHLEAAWKSELEQSELSQFDRQVREVEAETTRQESIQTLALAAINRCVGSSEKVTRIREMSKTAVGDRSVSVQKFELELLRAERTQGPILVMQSSTPQMSEEVLEAAICSATKLPNVEKQFSDQTLQSAHTRFRRGVTLKEVFAIAAERNNGYRGSIRDEAALCRAAFDTRGRNGEMMAVVGPSAINVPGILSNVANKFLAAMFQATEQSWRQVAKIRPANDFKQMTTYRLTGSTKFEKVSPTGELKHGSLSELPYTNQVETYGKVLGINRTDIINDDLGAFTNASSELSRGAGDSLNEVFYTEYLDDSDFFPTDGSKNNYDEGADTTLTLAGLELADNLFAAQTKPDNTPLGVDPAILFVPRSLRPTAITLMSATGLVGQGANAAVVANGSPWAGMFTVVSSKYLTSLGSALAWYLLADPMVCAVMEVAFLNGQETPTVETGEFEFDRLGLAMRAYMDFGCAKQEYRAGVKMKGAA